MPSKTERERVAIELQKWLKGQSRYRTIRDLQAATGIPYSSLKDYFSGRKFPSAERLQRLAGFTGLGSVLELLPSGTTVTSGQQPHAPEEMARRVLETAHRFMADLEYFKRGTADDRALLKTVVPPRDVGYLTTLLKAMYDEDQFATWLYFAEYKPQQR